MRSRQPARARRPARSFAPGYRGTLGARGPKRPAIPGHVPLLHVGGHAPSIHAPWPIARIIRPAGHHPALGPSTQGTPDHRISRRLKAAHDRDDTFDMKVCPHCGGQLRSSVIRCMHCGTSLIDESTEGGDGITAPDPTGGRRPVAARPAVPIATTKAQTDTEAPPRASDVRTPEPWAVPGVRAPRPPAPEPPAAHASADGTPRPNRPLMMSGVLAAAAGALAYSSLSIPWVHARISDAGAGASFVAELTLRGSDSIAGQAGLILAIALGLLGLLWFWYGLDQNAHLPAIAHPAWVLVVGLLALGVLTFAAIGTSAWRDAFVTYADDAGLGKRAMQELLAARSSAVIVVERVGGVLRFGAAASLALLAGALAWWAERRRG